MDSPKDFIENQAGISILLILRKKNNSTVILNVFFSASHSWGGHIMVVFRHRKNFDKQQVLS